MKKQNNTQRPRSFICIIMSYILQISLCICALLSYFLQTANFEQAQGSVSILRLHNLATIIIDIVIILTLTATSACYGATQHDSKQTFFWVLIFEIAIRGLLSFYTLTATEYNVQETIQEYQENGEKLPYILIMCHFKKKLETYASIIVTGMGIFLAKMILDSKVWEKDKEHEHGKEQKAE